MMDTFLIILLGGILIPFLVCAGAFLMASVVVGLTEDFKK